MLEEYEYILDNRPMYIAPGLWLGSADAEANLDALQGSGITHVLTVGVELVPSHGSRFKYLHIPVFDLPTENLVCHWRRMFAFIEEGIQSGGVLVHCMAGVSRSASTVIAYLMWRNKIPYYEARRHVAEIRPWISPNPGFQQQLLAFQDAGCQFIEADGN